MISLCRVIGASYLCALLVVGQANDAVVLFRDDFSGRSLSPAWVKTYEPYEVRPGLIQVRGLFLARHSVSWYVPSHEITIAHHRHGVRLAADVFFYPRPGFEWHQTGAPHPLGFQNSKGGVGTAYARFTFVDADRDKFTDTLRFETKSGDRRFSTDLAGYNPATDNHLHRLAIDWKPGEVKACFDGKPFATHKIRIKEPLWVAGRNEYINVLMDNFELVKLGRKPQPPGAAAAFSTKGSATSHAKSDRVRYWYFQGLHHEAYGIEQMFPAGVLTVSEAWSHGMAPPLPPIEYEELVRHDAAIIANADLRTIGPMGKRILRDYLRSGRGMLVLGGKAAYASGGWRGSVMEDVLPVRLSESPRDIEKLENGRLKQGDPHWITEGLDLSMKPRTDFINKVVGVKQGATVLLYAGNRPFLVIWEKDDYRVACILGTPYGSGEAIYFGWDGWNGLVRRTLLWLGRRD